LPAVHTIDLARLGLAPGQGQVLEAEIGADSLTIGGIRYSFGPPPDPARIDVSRTAAGHALRLRYAGELVGPCVRCLADAEMRVDVDAREVDQPGSGDEELTSPYVENGDLDLGAWAHDALVLALPLQVLCREDCAGLCAVCGESLNDAAEGAHEHPSEPDPRWAKLRELQ
jgi:uncharacterized protein